MQAFEFDAKKNFIEIPPEYHQLYSKHLKVIILVDEQVKRYDFSDVAEKLEWQGDAVQEQRKMRDEW